MADYPQREKYFAHRFTRKLLKAAIAQQISPEACWLLTVIVHTEDAKRYSAPVTFWNEQLQSLLGFGGRSRLVRARNKAIEAGWLHYEPGGKFRPGRYWVTVPNEFANLTDGPVDDSPLPNGEPSQNGTANKATHSVQRPKTGRQEDGEATSLSQNRTAKAVLGSQNRTATGRQPDGKRAPFLPIPIPNPSDHSDHIDVTLEDELAEGEPAQGLAAEFFDVLGPLSENEGDCALIWQLAWLVAAGAIARQPVVEALRGPSRARERPGGPVGYVRTTLAGSIGTDCLAQCLARLPDRPWPKQPPREERPIVLQFKKA
jgi:hypothetical protein